MPGLILAQRNFYSQRKQIYWEYTQPLQYPDTWQFWSNTSIMNRRGPDLEPVQSKNIVWCNKLSKSRSIAFINKDFHRLCIRLEEEYSDSDLDLIKGSLYWFFGQKKYSKNDKI